MTTERTDAGPQDQEEEVEEEQELRLVKGRRHEHTRGGIEFPLNVVRVYAILNFLSTLQLDPWTWSLGWK